MDPAIYKIIHYVGIMALFASFGGLMAADHRKSATMTVYVILHGLSLIVILVAGIAVGGYFAWDTYLNEEDPDPADLSAVSGPAETSSPADEGVADPAVEPIGWTTPEDALAEQMPQQWVYDTLSDDGEIIEYIIGPPNSEYLDVVVVARQPDGSWKYVIDNPDGTALLHHE